MSIFRRHAWLGYLAVLVGIVLASLPTAEAFFRLIGDEPSFDLQGLYSPFAGDNYKLGSHVDTGASFAVGRVFVHTDDLGLRCDQARRFGIKRGSEVDFLIIGDSQGFGNGLNFEETVAGSFAVIAAKNGVRVANASVGGHSLASQLEIARWLVEKQEVIVRNYVFLFTPALIENSDRLNHVIVGEDGRLYGNQPNLQTKGLLWMKTRTVTYSRIRDAVRNAGIGAEPAKGSPTVLQFYREDGDGDSTVARLSDAMSAFRGFATKRGSSVHAVYIPLTVEAEFDSIRQAAAEYCLTVDPNRSLTLCRTVTERLGISLHNLKPVAEKVHRDGHILTVKADFHYSAVLSKACGAALWGCFQPKAIRETPQSTTKFTHQ